MKEAKFWLFQIVMVAAISLVFGSPVWADDDDDGDDRRSQQQVQHDDDDDDGFNDVRWHERWEKKLNKKTAKFERKMAKYEGNDAKQGKLQKRFDRWSAKHQRKLERHQARFGEVVADPDPPVVPDPPDETCSVDNQSACTAENCTPAGGFWAGPPLGCMFPTTP